MIDTLLIFQMVVGLLLIAAILLQRTSADGLSGLTGSNMNLVGAGSATKFISKLTIFLAIVFMSNAVLLGNLSSRNSTSVSKKIQAETPKEESLPIAK